MDRKSLTTGPPLLVSPGGMPWVWPKSEKWQVFKSEIGWWVAVAPDMNWGLGYESWRKAYNFACKKAKQERF